MDADHIELKQKLDQMQSLAITLQVQLSKAQSDLSDLRGEKEKLVNERNVERQALQDALDAAIIERAENDAKWQRDFEQLRTFNSGRIFLLRFWSNLFFSIFSRETRILPSKIKKNNPIFQIAKNFCYKTVSGRYERLKNHAKIA